MTPQTILAQLWDNGIPLRLTADGANLAAPAGRLSAEQRSLILSHKTELLAFLADAHKTTTQLVSAAMRACDHHGDTEAARQQMRADCLKTPPHQQQDLLQHFNRTYPQRRK